MLNGVKPGFLNCSNSELIHSKDCSESMYGSDEFRMYVFKIKRCPKNRSHDWTSCPFAHRGEKARRRDPRKFNYAAVACPEFRIGECMKGESCEFAHGVFEFWLHPEKYRTRACNAGKYCRRKVCFFAHTPEQLRPVMKQRYRYVCRELMGEGKKDISGARSGLSSPPANMLMNDGNLKEMGGISEKLRGLKIEDEEEEEEEEKEEEDGGERSFGFWDVSDLPDIDWIMELVN